MRTVRMAAAVLVLGCFGGALASAADLTAVMEKVGTSVVQVKFHMLQENGSKREAEAIGTVVKADGLTMISGDYLPRQVPDDKFVDFKVKFVHIKDQPELKAELLLRDPDLGVALVKLTEDPKEGHTLTPAPFGDDSTLKVGQELLGFGLLPGSYKATLDFGTGHMVKRVEEPQPLLITTGGLQKALLGPITTLDGQFIGFVVRDPFRGSGRFARSAQVVLPVSRLKELLSNPAKKRKRAWLGVADMQPLDKDVAQVMGMDEARAKKGGVIIGRVLEGQPAEKAGLQVNDVIVKLGEDEVNVTDDTGLRGFMENLKKLEIGQVLKLTVVREAKEHLVDVTIGERPKEVSDAERYDVKVLGLVLRELVYYDLLGRDLPLDQSGLYVHYVKSGSWPDLGGLKPGDILTKVDDVELKGSGKDTSEQLTKIVDEMKKNNKTEFMFFVSRGKKGQNAAFIKIEADWKEAQADEQKKAGE